MNALLIFSLTLLELAQNLYLVLRLQRASPSTSLDKKMLIKFRLLYTLQLFYGDVKMNFKKIT
ncbi:hypothetical protein SAMN05216238_11417 [Lentibacillus persicus]|uniref:Uncharacterized protein n=1 Tax=Lentibacillus persicus TaxID=640948 RepID=A0A1I2A0H1_9BACI|nr:hypothetical protein SAMN05216238_11417 [Lentibacillus persicus]